LTFFKLRHGVSYTVESPFGGVRSTAESPFGVVRYTIQSPFGGGR